MVETRTDADGRTGADAASDMSRLADVSARLFAEQAAAMAVMTVYGIRAASELTSMMLGGLRGPSTDTPSVDEAAASPPEPEPSAKVVPIRPNLAPAAETPIAARRPASKRARTGADAEASPKPARKSAAKVASKSAGMPARSATRKPVAGRIAEPTSLADVTVADDLKKIAGIGPRIEQELHTRGIRSYGDLASLGKAALRKLDDALGLDGRVIRDDWAGQAKALSGGKG